MYLLAIRKILRKVFFAKYILVVFICAKGDTLFRAEFAVLPNNNNKNCDYITYSYQGKSYKNRLHDKAYQLLTQIYSKPSTDTIPPLDSVPLPDSSD